MPKINFSKGVPLFRKSYNKTTSGIRISKIDRRTNQRIADLLVRKNGTSKFTKYENGYVSYRVDMQPNHRDYYVAQKKENGRIQYIKTKEMNMLHSFVEWYVSVFDKAGKETHQVIKFRGIEKPKTNQVPHK